MIEKNMNRLTATRLRLVLICSLVILAIFAAVGFSFAHAYLSDFAVQVSHANEDASTSDTDIATLQRLENQLEDEANTIERTRSLVAESKSYEYQDQIIADLNTYAQRSNVSVASFTFPTAAGAGAAAAGAATATAQPSISGLKATTVSVALATPVKYNNLMKFLHNIEKNLTKMKIASVALTKGATNDEVSISTLEIEVYIK